MTKAVIWIASGKQYIKEAIISARSVKEHNPDVTRVLCTQQSSVIYHSQKDIWDNAFDEFFILPERQYDLWFLDCTHYLIDAINNLDYDKLLLLDTDTYICDDLSDYFAILDRFDIVGTHAPGRVTAQTIFNIPASFPDLHIGAMAFNNSDFIKRLFDKWLELYQDNIDVYKDNDQAPLRDALWMNEFVQVYAMPPEYCFRFPFGGFLRGKCKVLHGRSQMSYEQIEQIVNKDWRKMRTFKRGMFR